MFYMIYLLLIFIYIICGIGVGRNLSSFIDVITLAYTVLPCILVLSCTRSLRAFGSAFSFALGQKTPDLPQSRDALRSVKMTWITAVLFGSLCFMIGMVNSISHLDLSAADLGAYFLRDLSVAILSLFYPALICIILLPVYFLLKKHIAKLGGV